MQDLERLDHAEPRFFEGFVKLRDLNDARCVGEENAAATQSRLGVGHDLPWFGEVEDDAIKVGLVDACVDIADLRPIPLEGLSAEEASHCGAGVLFEVFAKFVSDDVGASTQHAH